MASSAEQWESSSDQQQPHYHHQQDAETVTDEVVAAAAAATPPPMVVDAAAVDGPPPPPGTDAAAIVVAAADSSTSTTLHTTTTTGGPSSTDSSTVSEDTLFIVGQPPGVTTTVGGITSASTAAQGGQDHPVTSTPLLSPCPPSPVGQPAAASTTLAAAEYTLPEGDEAASAHVVMLADCLDALSKLPIMAVFLPPPPVARGGDLRNAATTATSMPPVAAAATSTAATQSGGLVQSFVDAAFNGGGTSTGMDRGPEAAVPLEALLPLTPFHSQVVPGISLTNYARQLRRHLNCPAECFGFATLYVCRYTLMTGHPLSPRSAHRLLLAALIVAMKYREDRVFSLEHIAAAAGVPAAELTNLEQALLSAIQYQLHVEVAEFESLMEAARRGPGAFVEACCATYQRHQAFQPSPILPPQLVDQSATGAPPAVPPPSLP